MSNAAFKAGEIFGDAVKALWEPPGESSKSDPTKNEDKILTNLQQEEIQKIEEKTKHPGFEVLIRVLASTDSKPRSEALLANVVSVFSQFDLQGYNGFRYDALLKAEDLARNYMLRLFPPERKSMVLNSVELASVFHLPSQKNIPTSQVERQATKQVDGPAKLPDEGIVLGINEFRGEKKVIRLSTKDRQRHTYVIGATGMGKSILLTNLAYQDMCDGRGFAFIDPHGDAVELLLSKVPKERADDIIVFEPGNMDNPVGMNMFEFQREDQKDFIVQEGINMLVSLYDPGNQGIFGPRAQHMFRNAALLLMSDPKGGTFIDIPRCFIDPEFVKEKLPYVTDKTVYDYWTKEFPQSQKSNDAGEVTSWFVSKWGPFLSNKMMRNILGQPKSGFNIREIMDNKKILLVNLSKGTTGELNAKLLGMIFVMKFQAAAMSRADTPEDQRVDFCLFVDEFQNFATESFESILSEARKYKLNLVLANQFMTQLTDKIREAILGNVGSIICGRIGVTDAELMQKAFQPVFNAEDLHKIPNHKAVATVLMFGLPTSPFTLNLLPPLGEPSEELMHKMKEYALSRFGRPRAEVEAEIEERLGVKPTAEEKRQEEEAIAMGKPAPKKEKKNFLDAWMDKKADMEAKAKEKARQANLGRTPAPIPEKKAEAVVAAPKPSAAPAPVAPVAAAVPTVTAAAAPVVAASAVAAPAASAANVTNVAGSADVAAVSEAISSMQMPPAAQAAPVEQQASMSSVAPEKVAAQAAPAVEVAPMAAAMPKVEPVAQASTPVISANEVAEAQPSENNDEYLAVDAGMVWSVAAAENAGADMSSLKITHERADLGVSDNVHQNGEEVAFEAESAPAASQAPQTANKVSNSDNSLQIQHDDNGATLRWR